jgi:hypothetical protein
MLQIRNVERFFELVVFENVRLSDLGLSAATATAKNDGGRFVITSKALAVRDGVERITLRSLDALDYMPLSEPRRSALRRELL